MFNLNSTYPQVEHFVFQNKIFYPRIFQCLIHDCLVFLCLGDYFDVLIVLEHTPVNFVVFYTGSYGPGS